MLCLIVSLVCSLSLCWCVVRLIKQVKNLRKLLHINMQENARCMCEKEDLKQFLSQNTIRVCCKQRVLMQELKNHNREYIASLTSNISNAVIHEMAKTFQTALEKEVFGVIDFFDWSKLGQFGAVDSLDPYLSIEVPVFRVDIEGLKVKTLEEGLPVKSS